MDDQKKFNKRLGIELRKLREIQDLSQEDLAFKAGMSRTYIGSIERGEKSISVYKLFQILNALEVNHEEFFKII